MVFARRAVEFSFRTTCGAHASLENGCSRSPQWFTVSWRAANNSTNFQILVSKSAKCSRMERRSRSTSRKNSEFSTTPNTRHSSIGRTNFPPEINQSLLHRVGGDSRTLSPERKPHNYGFPKTSPHHSMNKSGSYNVYTHGQPKSQPFTHRTTKSSLKPTFNQVINPVTKKTTMNVITIGPMYLAYLSI